MDTGSSSKFQFGKDFQENIISLLVRDQQFLKEYGFDGVRPEHFDDWFHTHLVSWVQKYFLRYGVPPVASSLNLEAQEFCGKEGFGQDILQNFLVLIRDVCEKDIGSLEHIKTKVLNFLTDQSVRNAFDQGKELITEGKYEAFANLIMKAATSRFDRNLGLNFREHALILPQLFRNKFAKEFTVPSGFPTLDWCLKGGFRRGSLYSFVAYTGGLKTWVLTNISAYALQLGYNVAYYTLEGNEEEILFRVCCNLTGISYDQMLEAQYDSQYQAAIAKWMPTLKANLIIKHYPNNSINIQGLRSHLSRSKAMLDFQPMLLIVDYADLLLPMEYKDMMYEDKGNIYYDLVKLGEEYSAPVVSACFTGDTKISLLDGTERTLDSFTKGEKFWVYGCKPDGTVLPVEAVALGETKKVNELVEVTLDTGASERCTPDHLWMLRDGTYKEAKDLQSGDSLMPLYRKVTDLYGTLDEKGYEMYLDNSTGEYEFTHRMSLAEIENYSKENNTIHHKDFNKRNNSPSNRIGMTWEDHRKLHADQYETTIGRPDVREKQRLSTSNKWKNDASYRKRAGVERLAKLWSNREFAIKALKCLELGRTPDIVKKFSEFAKNNPEITRKAAKLGGEAFKNLLINDQKFADHISAVRKKTATESIKFKTAVFNNGKNAGKNRILCFIKKLLDTDKLISKETYITLRIGKIPTFDKVLYYYGSLEAAVAETKKLKNHIVKSIRIVSLQSSVYDISVPETDNFALSSGVFVHNSQPRGEYINAEVLGKGCMAASSIKEHVATGCISINRTKEEKDNNRFRFYPFKVRNGREDIIIHGLCDLDKGFVKEDDILNAKYYQSKG